MAKRTVEVTHAELTRLIELIEAKRAEAGKCPDAYDRDAWQAYLRTGREIIDALVASEGAVYRPRVGDTGRLKLGGIQTSATSGDFGLLRNWIAAAARRRVELSRGGAS